MWCCSGYVVPRVIRVTLVVPLGPRKLYLAGVQDARDQTQAQHMQRCALSSALSPCPHRKMSKILTAVIVMELNSLFIKESWWFGVCDMCVKILKFLLTLPTYCQIRQIPSLCLHCVNTCEFLRSWQHEIQNLEMIQVSQNK